MIITPEDQVAFWTKWLFMATGTLAVTTIFLAIFTGRLWSTTKASLNRIDREFLATHRPLLVVRQIEYVRRPEGDLVKYTVANVGMSTAKITRSKIRVWTEGKGKEWPAAPPYSECTQGVPNGAIEAGRSFDHSYQEPAGNMDMTMAAVITGAFDTMLLGYIEYSDENDIPRRVGFCRKRIFGRNRFEAVVDGDYEYSD